jgi:hypothetical protein
MFKWPDPPDGQIIVRLPFEIYWATSLSVTLILGFGMYIWTATENLHKWLRKATAKSWVGEETPSKGNAATTKSSNNAALAANAQLTHAVPPNGETMAGNSQSAETDIEAKLPGTGKSERTETSPAEQEGNPQSSSSGVLLQTTIHDPEPSDSLKRQRPLTHTSDVGTGSLQPDSTDDGWRLFIFALKYFFVILPIDEIRFAYGLSRYFRKQVPPPPTTQTAQPEPSQKEAAAGKPPIDKDSKPVSDKAGQATEMPPTWHWRGGIRQSASVIFSLIRVCILPLWICLLYIEVFLFLIAYAIVSLLFKESPLQKTAKQLKGYLGTNRGRNKRAKQAKGYNPTRLSTRPGQTGYYQV